MEKNEFDIISNLQVQVAEKMLDRIEELERRLLSAENALVMSVEVTDHLLSSVSNNFKLIKMLQDKGNDQI